MTAPGSPEGPNAEQIRYWNEVAGPRWVSEQPRLDAMIDALGTAAIDRAAPAPGEHVLDVGCGCGATSLELARRVAPQGSVVGVDVSAPMLAIARRRAAGSPGTIRFEEADAQTHDFAEASFDLLFSRFGVMFFADPHAAFANLQRALTPRGRLAFVCWQDLARNPWMTVPLSAIARVLPLPPPPAPDAPGPFAFADRERVAGLLAAAGFGAITFDSLEQTLWVGGRGASIAEAADFALQLGPAAAALRDAPPELRQRAATAIREAIAPHASRDGIEMPAAAWIVTARRS